uniref:G_PROTEIN_RECEP_F1_2 domain-containing protein n=1 Tax=Syphacia muris TaxID=451379 RepID=A0A158R692_9BILA
MKLLSLHFQLIFSLLYATIFVVGVIGNGLLISVLARRRRYSVPTIFLINLAISDLLLCLTSLPITPVLAFYKQWYFGQFLCKIVPVCQTMSVLISSYCLCFIAVDRYRSIVIQTLMPWAANNAYVLVAASWAASFAASSPLYYTQGLKTIQFHNDTFCGMFCGEYNWPSNKRIKTAYGSVIFAFQYLFPLAIMSFCYWKILVKVRSDWIVTEGSMLTEAQQAQASVRKKRVMYMLIVMVAAFMGSWLPLMISNLLRDFGIASFLDQQTYFKLLTAHAMAMTSVIWNPVLYFWMCKGHRKDLKREMLWLTNVRRGNQLGILTKFQPSPYAHLVYRRMLENHLATNNRHVLVNSHKEYHPGSYQHHQLQQQQPPIAKALSSDFLVLALKHAIPLLVVIIHFFGVFFCIYRRRTVADPSFVGNERMLAEMYANCFLLVPLVSICHNNTAKTSATSNNNNNNNNNTADTASSTNLELQDRNSSDTDPVL